MSITRNLQLATNKLVLPDKFVEARMDTKTDITVKSLILEYVNNFDKYADKGLAPSFFGSAGTGKTYASAILTKGLVARGIPVLWYSTVTLLNDLMDYKDFKLNSYFAIKDAAKNTAVIVLDDIGQVHEYPRIRELFFELVDYRYAWNRPTIFTANFVINTPNDWINEVASCFNLSIARRIQQMSQDLLHCTVKK